MSLKYKLKDNAVSPHSKTPMLDYLKRLGIKKPEHFLGPLHPEDEISPTKLINIEAAIKRLKSCFDNNEKVFLQVDSDTDGYTSAAIFYLYFKKRFPSADITWRLHEGKEHGVIINTVPQDCSVIVLPDSGSVQIKEQEELVATGKTVIILDHHEVDNYYHHPNVIIVNNQISPEFENKFLSGAGVTFKTIQLFDSTYFDGKLSGYYYDLAALGIVSDMMDSTELDNNYIIRKGLSNINNPQLRAILHKQTYAIKNTEKPTKIDIAFYVTPLINGTIRAGTNEEKRLLFRGFIGAATELVADGEIVLESGFYAHIAKLAANIKGRQDNRKMKCVPFLINKIELEGRDKNQVIVAITSDDDAVTVPQNITGLVAMELNKHYGKPVLVLRPKRGEDGEMTYAGSGRAKKVEGLESFRELVRDTEDSVFAEGHSQAFGASITASRLDNFLQECNEKLSGVTFETEYEVDAIITPTNNCYDMLYEFSEYDYVYGNNIPQPRIAIEMRYDQSNARVMGAKQTSSKFKCGRVDCVLFKNGEVANYILNSISGDARFVGRVQMNEFMGNKSPQIIIDEYEITPSKTKSLF